MAFHFESATILPVSEKIIKKSQLFLRLLRSTITMNTLQRKFTDLQYRRLQGGKLIEQGYDNQEIADILGCGLSTVRLWRRIVKKHGVDALAPKPRTGRPPKLQAKQLAKLKRLLKKGATNTVVTIPIGSTSSDCRRTH